MHDNTNPTRPKVTVPLNKFVSLVMYFLQCCYVSPITSRKSSGKGEVHIWQSIASWLRLFVCRNKLPRRWHQSQWIYSVRRRWETLTTRAIMFRLRCNVSDRMGWNYLGGRLLLMAEMLFSGSALLPRLSLGPGDPWDGSGAAAAGGWGGSHLLPRCHLPNICRGSSSLRGESWQPSRWQWMISGDMMEMLMTPKKMISVSGKRDGWRQSRWRRVSWSAAARGRSVNIISIWVSTPAGTEKAACWNTDWNDADEDLNLEGFFLTI